VVRSLFAKGLEDAHAPGGGRNGSPDSERELAGGTVIWLFVAVELLTFGLFFISFAVARRADPALFLAGQEILHPLLGAIKALQLTWHSSWYHLEFNLGASANVGGLCHAAERPVR
jgi:heme/copper-type cytochrome/quinol oxidase subunit 3